MRIVDCRTPEETFALGRALGRAAFPGAWLALVGDLGAGKTKLAGGVAAGLGVVGRVQSPTFVLVQVREGGRLPLWHADLYRLGDGSELDAIGLSDPPPDAVVVVEWADRFPDALPADRLEVQLSEIPGDPDARRVTLRATGPLHATLEAADVP